MNPAFVLEVPPSLDIKLTIETPLHCTGSALGHRTHRVTTISRRCDILQFCHPQGENGGKSNVCRNVWTMNWQCTVYEAKYYQNSAFFYIFYDFIFWNSKLQSAAVTFPRTKQKFGKHHNYKQITSYTDHETNSVTFHFWPSNLYTCIREVRGSNLKRHRLTWRRLVVIYIHLASIGRDTSSNRPRPIPSTSFSIIIHQPT